MLEPVLVSALEHWSYCPRQCGLVHVESVWDENVFTIRGKDLHERVDQPTVRTERGRRSERALPIWNDELGLFGRADLVEIRTDGTPVPVEYKSGKTREDGHAAIQLCAQALCLEEMFQRPVLEGAVFFAASQKREPVAIGPELRDQTVATIEAVRRMIETGVIPLPIYDRRCRNCSLQDACLPKSLAKGQPIGPEVRFKPANECELP